MLRTIICDDEGPALELLADMLQETGEVDIVATCKSAKEALSIINQGGIDLAFFDVEMPEVSGVSAAARIAVDPKPLLVFATAHPEYAVDAFGIDAIDYILKPFDQDRITKSVQKASRMVRLIRENLDKPSQSEAFDGNEPTSGLLKIKDAGRIYFIPMKNIIWVEAAGDYSLLHTETNEIVVRKTITSLESDLPRQSFVRVHRSYIISIEHITEVKRLAKGEAEIRLLDDVTVRASRSYRDVIIELLN